MNKHHQEIVKLYSSHQGNYSSKHSSSYVGSHKFSYSISTPESRKLVKGWLKAKPPFTPAQYRRLLDSLSRGKSHNEFSAIGKLLEYCPKLRQTLDPESLGSWLDRAEGWVEIDSICQGNFTSEEILSRHPDSRLSKLAFENINNLKSEKDILITKAISWLLRDLIANPKALCPKSPSAKP